MKDDIVSDFFELSLKVVSGTIKRDAYNINGTSAQEGYLVPFKVYMMDRIRYPRSLIPKILSFATVKPLDM